jgi:hypothetical protein
LPFRSGDPPVVLRAFSTSGFLPPAGFFCIGILSLSAGRMPRLLLWNRVPTMAAPPKEKKRRKYIYTAAPIGPVPVMFPLLVPLQLLLFARRRIEFLLPPPNRMNDVHTCVSY